MKRTAALLLALSSLLFACTGTEENAPALRLAVITDGGATLRTVTPNDDASATPVTDNQTLTIAGGVSVDTLPSGNRLALTLAAGIQSLDANLGSAAPFAALPFTATCLTHTATSAARDRLLTLSECVGGPQELALYRADGTLVWTARLPTFLPPAPGLDNPPIRLAVRGDVGVVTRPRVGGGSETLRAAQDKVGDVVAVVSDPLPTPAIRDLAPYGNDILAATDTGIQTLKATGEPDGVALSAFDAGRYDRLWTGSASSARLLAAWRSNILSTTASEPLWLWDGAKTKAVIVAYQIDLRDVSLALDGNLYALTATSLTRYDTVFGLQQGNWRPRTLLGTLNDARSVTWVVPPTP